MVHGGVACRSWLGGRSPRGERGPCKEKFNMILQHPLLFLYTGTWRHVSHTHICPGHITPRCSSVAASFLACCFDSAHLPWASGIASAHFSLIPDFFFLGLSQASQIMQPLFSDPVPSKKLQAPTFPDSELLSSQTLLFSFSPLPQDKWVGALPQLQGPGMHTAFLTATVPRLAGTKEPVSPYTPKFTHTHQP